MVQNAPKPRGRPRSFDERDALEKATQVFRSKGYDGVTIDDLVAGMGVGRPLAGAQAARRAVVGREGSTRPGLGIVSYRNPPKGGRSSRGLTV